jgi:2'-5' RNA ligase
LRLFVAVYPPEAAVADLATFVSALHVGRAAAEGVNTRLARPETYHLTLAFLGEVPDERLADVEVAIGRAVDRYHARASTQARRAARAATAERHVQVWPAVPELALSGGGRFGRGAFTLMWIGVGGDLDPMRALHKALRGELKRARFPYDERQWKPHLTVARPGNRIPRADLDADRAALDAYAGQAWPVRELFLVRSNLGPEPTYERLSNWLL